MTNFSHIIIISENELLVFKTIHTLCKIILSTDIKLNLFV